ncbi:ABC transporter substrate-binding protein [Nakamurella lactea]|uniref:ABC transporter substrate-binding protein n=1 Tax=Nakamurella lactea TaxID=459515 RepID=UPI0003F737E6|nr:ABC transporter substrate-binding protein [Nakamurella lactea]
MIDTSRPVDRRSRTSLLAATAIVVAIGLTACADPQQDTAAVSPAAAGSSVGSQTVASGVAAVTVPDGYNTSPDQHRVSAATDPAAVAKLPASIKKSGTLVVGGGFAGGGLPPLGFTADDDRTPIGVEVDFAQLIADKLGLKAELQVTSWENLFVGVDSGKYQVAVSNIGVSEERKEKYDFATYRLGLHAFEAKKGSGLKVTGPADLAGKKVAVGSGTLQEGILLDWDAKNKAAGLPAIDIRYYQSATDYYLALASGRIDLYLGPNPTATYHVATAGQTEIVGTVSSSYPLDGKVAVMTKKGNGLVAALAAAVDSAIADGSYQQVLERWGLSVEAVASSEINPAGLPKPTAVG